MAQAARSIEVGNHDRERFVVSSLAAPQFGYRGRVGGVDDQVEPADAFDGRDPT
jgi:hypothetical protein